MTPRDDFDQTLTAWLRGEAPDQAPDRLLDEALQQAAQQPQRRGWLDRLQGSTRWGRVVRLSALAAVIVAAAFVGLQFAHLTGPGVGGPSSSSSLPSPSSAALPTSSPKPTPTTPADRTPSADCINPPVDVLTLNYQSDPVACYGGASVTVDAYLVGGFGAIDGPCTAIEPAWFNCASWVELDPVRAPAALTMSNLLVACSPACGDPVAFLFAAIDPAAGIVIGEFDATNVRVTGHFDDPAAQTCNIPKGLIGWDWETPPPASYAIESCRRIFVVTRIVPLGP